MEKQNYLECCSTIDAMDAKIKSKIHCYNYGAWNENIDTVAGREQHASRESNSILKADNLILEKSEQFTVRLRKLDDCLKDEKITLLKMDIEGAEQSALQGAEEIIRRSSHPKLAICIYHRLDDMWEIPLSIKRIVPDYNLAIRLHASDNFWEEVCYAYL